MIHARQEFRDGEVPAFLQQVHPPAQVPLQTGINVRHHALLLVLVLPSLHVKPPQGIHHICIQICTLKNQHVQMRGGKAFIIPLPPPVMSSTGCFTLHGVSIPMPSFARQALGGCPHGQVEGALVGLSTPSVLHWAKLHSGRGALPTNGGVESDSLVIKLRTGWP